MTGTRAPAAPASGYVALPAGWERVSARGPGPFLTREVVLRPDGTLVHWRSRAHRKSASHATRWLAVLFAVGSVCFLVASVAAQWASSPRPAIGVTFFVGSLLFTRASSLGYTEAVNVPRERLRARWLRFRPAAGEPRRIDWLAAATRRVIDCNAALMRLVGRGRRRLILTERTRRTSPLLGDVAARIARSVAPL